MMERNGVVTPTVLLVVWALLLSHTFACPSMEDCAEVCEFGFAKDKEGCEICHCLPAVCQGTECKPGKVCREFVLSFTMHKVARCIDPTTPPKCHQPNDPGPCDTDEERYFFNQSSGECQTFIYGGCEGNANNFRTEEECDMGCKTGMCDGVATCDLFCEHGRVRDSNGCEMCECQEEDSPPPTCFDIRPLCKMHCENGFRKDRRGCEICECNAECGDFMCMMHCEEGFLQDRDGCDVCKCAGDIRTLAAESAVVEGSFTECPEIMCMLYCDNGYVVNDDGCPMCKCQKVHCELLVKCELFCEFGHVLDAGCPTCECQENPCEADPVNCPEPLICHPIKGRSGNWHAVCEDPQAIEEARPWCKNRVMCQRHCSFGFYTDEYGCDVCECRTTEIEECEPQECFRNCEFGHRYDENRCKTCECLGDPCEDKECVAEQVCEQKKFCKTCPSIGFCLNEKLVRRIKIILTYTHPAVNDLDTGDFEEAVENSISQLMSVDDEYIRGISVRTPMESATTVEMHVVTYGNMDLVNAFEKLRAFIRDQPDYASIFFNGLTFEPSENSVEVDYSSDPDFEMQEVSDEEGNEGDNTMMIIIIVCVCVGVLVVIIGSVAGCLVCRNKKSKKKEIQRLSVSYHQAATTDSSTQP